MVMPGHHGEKEIHEKEAWIAIPDWIRTAVVGGLTLLVIVGSLAHLFDWNWSWVSALGSSEPRVHLPNVPPLPAKAASASAPVGIEMVMPRNGGDTIVNATHGSFVFQEKGKAVSRLASDSSQPFVETHTIPLKAGEPTLPIEIPEGKRASYEESPPMKYTLEFLPGGEVRHGQTGTRLSLRPQDRIFKFTSDRDGVLKVYFYGKKDK